MTTTTSFEVQRYDETQRHGTCWTYVCEAATLKEAKALLRSYRGARIVRTVTRRNSKVVFEGEFESPLVNSLRRVTDWLEAALSSPNFHWDGDQHEAAEQCRDEARAAIAKAGGK